MEKRMPRRGGGISRGSRPCRLKESWPSSAGPVSRDVKPDALIPSVVTGDPNRLTGGRIVDRRWSVIDGRRCIVVGIIGVHRESEAEGEAGADSRRMEDRGSWEVVEYPLDSYRHT